MLPSFRFRLFSFLLFFLSSQCKPTIDDLPKLTGPIVDPSQTLSFQFKNELEAILKTNQSETSHQIVVYIAPKLIFDSIEEESLKIFEKWQLGLKGKDNGVLFILAPNDRKVRIEVGYGLESVLTDVSAKRIIDELIIPNMKANDIQSAVRQGTLAIMDQINSDSPTILSQSCPSEFSDKKGRLHETTIPLLKKEINQRSALKNYEFRFCVSDVSQEISLEAQGNGIYKNIKETNKKKVVFLTSSNGWGKFFGKIVTDPNLSWLFSNNRKLQIFRNQYGSMQEGDMTNYAYNAFLELIEILDNLESKQSIKSNSGLQDPYNALDSFSEKNVNEYLNKIETELKVPTSVLLLKIGNNVNKEIQDIHKKIFGSGNGIVLLISLNEKNIFLHTNDKTVFPGFSGKIVTINNDYLIDKIRFNARKYMQENDVDWVASDASSSLYYLIKSYNPSDTTVNNSDSLKNGTVEEISKSNSQSNSYQEPGLIPVFRYLLLVVMLFAFIFANGMTFFSILFYYASIFYRDFFDMNGFNTSLLEIFFILISIILGYALLFISRKLNIAKPVYDFVNDFNSSVLSSGSSDSSTSGSSYSSSYSSSSRSSSSYSGGGGRSGGGGASGSW